MIIGLISLFISPLLVYKNIIIYSMLVALIFLYNKVVKREKGDFYEWRNR